MVRGYSESSGLTDSTFLQLHTNKQRADLSGTELLDLKTMQRETAWASERDIMEEFPAMDTAVGRGPWKRGENIGRPLVAAPPTSYAGNSPFSLFLFFPTI